MHALQLLRRARAPSAIFLGQHVRTLSVAITERCAQRITSLNERRKEGTLERMLRLSVEPGGCSGFSYKFEMTDASDMEEEDTVFEEAGAKVVVDEGSLALLTGAVVDFEDDMLKSAFVIAENPMSESGCGCGTSFDVKM
uniref:Core domain-containing protein n=1 Tax=Phaeocystis antarctica TaxID=33657 RepID=A0A7S0E6N7_9EUKA|mmetsp:Transcript_61823/g.148930  ORF Transcript_61823/g.148930 Transcript_61823/m.148930 type:complete len:140 (-) Transcript_61823:201-620(-)